jgi:uncharacterized lipoprotein YmbA
MSQTLRARVACRGAASLLVVLSACVSLEPRADPARYYVLAATSGERGAPADQGRIVCFQPPVLPDYLRGREIAIRQGDHGIVYSEFALWAEPLEDGVARVLARELAAQPGVARVVPRLLLDDACDADVNVWLLSFECVERAARWHLEMAASWEIRDPAGTLIAQGTFDAPPNAVEAGDHERLASLLSGGLGALARAIGQSLASAPPHSAHR